MTLTPTELALLDRWQRNFPLVALPFEVVGQSVGLGPQDTVDTYERLRRERVLSRIGAVVRPHAVGASTLAAMRVPPERLEEVAAIVSGEPLVTHNYERTNALNLWFVVAGPDSAAVAATLASIEANTGLPVIDLPLLQAYHLDLGFSLTGGRARRRAGHAAPPPYQPDATDRRLLSAIENGLPLVQRPYRSIAAATGLTEPEVLERLRRLSTAGVVTRFGCVVHHRALGYTANAMAVWAIADDDVDGVARAFAANPHVTLCYRRARRPAWPFNLYCMIHARSQAEALAHVAELNAAAGTANRAQTVLFSPRCFKQRGAVFSARHSRAH